MKKLVFLFCVVFGIIVSSCAKFEDQAIVAPSATNSEYSLKSGNATLLGDTNVVIVNDLVVFTFEKNGVKIVADFNFANSTPVASGTTVATKFSQVGVYVVKATDLSVTPNVTKTAIVKAVKAIVVPPPPTSGETTIVVIASSYLNGTNSITLGLRCDVVAGFIPALTNAEVQYEMLPSVAWTKKDLVVSEVTTVNGIKYYKWAITVADNQKIRFGWLIGANWAYDPKCIYRQSDGLYTIYFKSGAIYAQQQSASAIGAFGDTKVRGSIENVLDVQNVVLYFQKSLFNSGVASVKYNIDNATEKTVNLVESSDVAYFMVKIPLASNQELAFWPLSSVEKVDISGSMVWNNDRACGLLKIVNMKSTMNIKLG